MERSGVRRTRLRHRLCFQHYLTDRGRLDSTLVAWTGEFGRTPKINGGGGRDHWGRVYSTVLAGAGIAGVGAVGGSLLAGIPVDAIVCGVLPLMAVAGYGIWAQISQY